ncbi:CHK kinase-like [Fusarium oxysporum f. sp. vasinfectum]|nr:CHK kinase-like [Fusarium oxysporum f. sp. vasinfectum]
MPTLTSPAPSPQTNGMIHRSSTKIGSDDPLPLTVNEISPDWFSKILGKKVEQVTIVDSLHGTASKILVLLSYENPADEPTTLCVKGGFNPAILALHPSLFHVYWLEAVFYHHLGPIVNLRLPPSHYCGTHAESGQGIVVLSDLKADGYTFVSRVRGGVEQLAILHAKTWGHKAEDFQLSAAFSLRDVITSLMLPSEWDKRFTGEAKPPVADYLVDRERIVAAFQTLWNTSDSKMNCVVHGDAHIGNTFVTPAGEPGFLDWQGVHAGSAIHDVAYFIIGSLSVEDRRKNEVELFEYYLKTLHEKGGPRFEKDEVWEEYRKHTFHGFAWALASPLMQSQEIVDTMSARHSAAIVDHKSLELLETLAARRPE